MIAYFQRLRIETKLWLVIAFFALVGVADNLSELALIDRRLHAEKELQLKHLVDTALSVVQSAHRESAAGRLSDEAARRQAARAVGDLHYGGREYFWIHDESVPAPRMVMHPTLPALDGQVLDADRFNRATAFRPGDGADYQAVDRTNLFVAMNRAIARSGDGFVRYDWPKPLPQGGVSEKFQPKLSYVKHFAPWGWVVGSGIYIDDLEHEYWGEVRSRLVKAALWLLLLGAVAWFAMRTMVNPLRAFRADIDALRANPDQMPTSRADQPGELGHLMRSFVGLMEDLRRSRRELTASIDKLRKAARAFAEVDDGVLMIGADGRILSLNPAFSRLTGYAPEELAGHDPARLFPTGEATSLTDRLRGEATGAAGSDHLRLRHKDGSEHRYTVSWLAARPAAGAPRFHVVCFVAAPGEAT